MENVMRRNDDAIAMKEKKEKKREKYFFILLHIKIIKFVLTKNIVTVFLFVKFLDPFPKILKWHFKKIR